jgi:hypothetical protein
MDTGQYTHGILETQFILVIESLPGDSIAYTKNLKVLTGKKLNAVRPASGIQRLELPSSSPDLNPIGNLYLSLTSVPACSTCVSTNRGTVGLKTHRPVWCSYWKRYAMLASPAL